MIGGKVIAQIHQQIAGVQYLIVYMRRHLNFTAAHHPHFVGIIQLLCNPDGYNVVGNLSSQISKFLYQIQMQSRWVVSLSAVISVEWCDRLLKFSSAQCCCISLSTCMVVTCVVYFFCENSWWVWCCVLWYLCDNFGYHFLFYFYFSRFGGAFLVCNDFMDIFS